MKKTSIFNLALLALMTTSTVYAADKYPLDPAYAANKKAMTQATAYEDANISPSAPSSGGEQWKLIYSGRGISSVNISNNSKFVSVNYGQGLQVFPVPTDRSNILLSSYSYTTRSCSGVPGDQHGTQCSSKSVTIRVYLEGNKVYSSNQNANNNAITTVYTM